MALQTSHEKPESRWSGDTQIVVSAADLGTSTSFQDCPRGAATNGQGMLPSQMEWSPSMKASACSFSDAFLKSVPQSVMFLTFTSQYHSRSQAPELTNIR